MDKSDIMRRTLINSVAYIYANEGDSRATTKNISKRAGYNEAYIYRLFKSKEDLIRCAFKFNDDVFVALLLRTVPIMKMQELPFYDRCYTLFMRAFELMFQTTITQYFICDITIPNSSASMLLMTTVRVITKSSMS